MGKKKKKLKMHGTLHRESQGSLIYQIKRHIKKLSTNLWLTSRDYFIWWTCFHDEKRAFFWFLLEVNVHSTFHPSGSAQVGRVKHRPFPCAVLVPCWASLRFSVFSVTIYRVFSAQTRSPSHRKPRGTGSRGRLIHLIFLVVSSHSLMTSL